MSWSLFEARDQLAEQARRQEEAQRQQQAPPVPAAAPVPMAAPSAGAAAGGSYGTAGMAMKDAAPDVTKGKKKHRAERIGRDLRDEAPGGAHEMASGADDAAEAGHDAGKAFSDRGIREGPGNPVRPGSAGPQDFRRPNLTEGRAAPSPVAEPPRDFPVPGTRPVAGDFTRGPADPPDNRPHGVDSGMSRLSPPVGEGQRPAPQVPEAVGMPVPHRGEPVPAQVNMSGALAAAQVPSYVTQSLSMPSPSER